MGAIPSIADKQSHQQPILDKLYLDREKTGDITFVVQSRKIRVHKCVLAAISPKYEVQFYGLRPDEGDIIVKDVEAAEFEEFLQLFYSGQPALSIKNIEGVLSLAKQSLADVLIEECGRFLWKHWDTNFPLLYRLTHMYELESHRKQCLYAIIQNTEKFFKSNEFLDACSRDMLLQILKSYRLTCKETEIFNSCVTWARLICSRNNVDEGRTENLRAALGDIIYEIRFLSMTFEEFSALHKSYQGLFTPDETVELMYMFGCVKDFKPQKFCPYVRNPKILGIERIVHQETTTEFTAEIQLVSFSCNKAIGLTGFDHQNGKLKVTVTGIDEKSKVFWPKYELVMGKTGVILHETIGIEANDHVEIDLNILSSSIGIKYELAKTVELDDLNFAFNVQDSSSDSPNIWLTELFFYRKERLSNDL